jgi:hypothetical protein
VLFVSEVQHWYQLSLASKSGAGTCSVTFRKEQQYQVSKRQGKVLQRERKERKEV